MNRLRLQEKLQKKKRETSVLEKLDGQRAKLQEEGGATPANFLTYMEALDKYSNRPAFRPLLEQSALHSVLLDSLDDFTKFQQKFVQTTNKKKEKQEKEEKEIFHCFQPRHQQFFYSFFYCISFLYLFLSIASFYSSNSSIESPS